MTSPPLALLCDAAFSALPILWALKRRGFRVAVCGSRASDPGHCLADVSFSVDYANSEAILDLARKEDISCIVPGCTDVSYLTCSSVAEKLGLPGVDTERASKVLHRKDHFRAFCTANGFVTPKSTTSLDEAMNLTFPLLVKPTDSFSGRGIVKVDSANELADCVRRARAESRSRSVVLEEYVSGQLRSHSAFVRDGLIVDEFFVNEFCTVYPYQVNSSHVWTDVDEDVRLAMRRFVESSAKLLKLADGLVHTQFITIGSVPCLIEVMRRCPGDLYARLIERSTGRDYSSLYTLGFCSDSPVVQASCGEVRFWSRHTVSVDSERTYLASRLRLPAKNVAFVPLKRTGERLLPAPMDRAGIYFIEHETERAMQEITPILRDFVDVEDSQPWEH